MANIAYLYISKGLYKEAREVLQKALEREEPHQSVFEARTELDKKEKEEQEYHKKILEKALQQRYFLRLYTDARFLSEGDANVFLGNWFTESGFPIDLSLEQERLIGSWQEMSGFLSTTKRTHRISGFVTKRSAQGLFTAEATMGQGILGYEPEKNRNFIAYLTHDGFEIHLMFLDKEEPMFRYFSRKQKINA